MRHAAETCISADYLRHVVESLERFRSHPLGGRCAGTPEERAAAEFVASEMHAIGLLDVVKEDVPVDAWRFEGASVEVEEGPSFDAASWAGVPETPPDGVTGELVDVGRGGRRQLAWIDVAGRVALVDWRDQRFWPYYAGLKLGLRGARAMIVACGRRGPFFQAEGAIGTFDAMWHPQAPPMVTVRKEAAIALAAAAGSRVRVTLRAPLTRRASATNVVGLLPGRKRRAPMLVGGHHDAWFAGAFDDATGVAATLALARAYVESGDRPERPIAFLSHTAEEYGVADSRFDCYGAWYQITVERRDWAGRAPFYLNIEGSGLGFRLRADPPPELAGWVRRVLRGAERDGLLPHGFALAPPTTATEVWPFVAAGVPGVNVSSFAAPWYRTDYHTPFDTSDRIDFEYLARLTRVYARLLAVAGAAPDAILDYAARAAHLRRSLKRLPATPARVRLERAAVRLAGLRSRQPFTSLARGLSGLDAAGASAYPHEQAARDARALELALAALRSGSTRAAARHAATVGMNRLRADLSREAFVLERARTAGSSPRSTWAGLGRLDPGPDLWEELSSLRGEAGARTPSPWLERRLERHLEHARRELERRLDRMAVAVEGKRQPLRRGGYPSAPAIPPAS